MGQPSRPGGLAPGAWHPLEIVRPGLRLAQLLTLSDQTDETGRLLLEDSAPPPAIRRAERAGISMETVTCAYPDTPSRVGGRMNASAYDALRRDTADPARIDRCDRRSRRSLSPGRGTQRLRLEPEMKP